jgi:hypothetical protein
VPGIIVGRCGASLQIENSIDKTSALINKCRRFTYYSSGAELQSARKRKILQYRQLTDQHQQVGVPPSLDRVVCH